MSESASLCQPVTPPFRPKIPREDGAVFAHPALRDGIELARANRESFLSDETNIQGRPLRVLREWTREAALAAAAEFTSQAIGQRVEPPDADFCWVTGHQPGLFHPGVWAKNFAVDTLRERAGGVGVNLIIDNDAFSSTRIRVPAGDGEHPRFDTVPFDADRPTEPWEDARILDADVFRSFGEHVVRAMREWNINPLAAELWPDAVDYSRQSPLIWECLTAARARMERRWGSSNLELPMSRLCRLDPFLWFTGHLLAHLPRFHEVHNAAVREYRRVNRVRSRTHPVPELSSGDGWLEAPFWIWRAGEHERRRLFAKQVGRSVWLFDGEEVLCSLRLSPEMDACCAVEDLRELSAQGYRLRTRALTTTLFSRLCLADLFVHGVGGAKYDEMTDRIIERFFARPAPAFLTFSVTAHLPLAQPFNVSPVDEHRLRGLLRELRFNSDRHAGGTDDPAFHAAAAEKRQLVAAQQAARSVRGQTRRARRARARENHDRYLRLQETNRRLEALNSGQSVQVERELEEVRRQLAANKVLQSREFAFCLFPAEKLRAFLTHLWQRSQ